MGSQKPKAVLFRELYYKPNTGFIGLNNLYPLAKDRDKTVKKQDVQKFLSRQEVYQIHRSKKKDIPLPILADSPNEIWQCDLMDVGEYAKYNKGFRYIFCAVDVFTRRCMALEPMKAKDEDAFLQVIQKVFDREGFPQTLASDGEKALSSAKVKRLLQDKDVNLVQGPGDKRVQGIIEGFNYTIRRKIERYLDAYKTFQYIDALPDFREAYDNTPHKLFSVAPKDVGKIYPEDLVRLQNEVRENIALDKLKKAGLLIEPGEKVRVMVEKATFDKGSKPNWSEEMYTVKKRIKGRYLLEGDDAKYPAYQLQKVGDVQYNPYVEEGGKLQRVKVNLANKKSRQQERALQELHFSNSGPKAAVPVEGKRIPKKKVYD